jgi:hypothetical protein
MSPERIAAIEERLMHKFALDVDKNDPFVFDEITDQRVDIDDILSERHADIEALLVAVRTLRSALETLGKTATDAYMAMVDEDVLPETTGRLWFALDVASKALALEDSNHG